MSDKHWSRHVLFLAPITLIVIVIVLALMFYTFKFFNTLYIELMIVIDIIGNWLKSLT